MRAACPRDSADISVKPQARLCYNIYVTLSSVVGTGGAGSCFLEATLELISKFPTAIKARVQ